MNQDGGRAGVVGVDVVDGQVVGGDVFVVAVHTGDGEQLAVRFPDLLSGMEVDCVGEAPGSGVPERMVVGRCDLRPVVEADVDHRVLTAVLDDLGDGPGGGLAGLGVGG